MRTVSTPVAALVALVALAALVGCGDDAPLPDQPIDLLYCGSYGPGEVCVEVVEDNATASDCPDSSDGIINGTMTVTWTGPQPECGPGSEWSTPCVYFAVGVRNDMRSDHFEGYDGAFLADLNTTDSSVWMVVFGGPGESPECSVALDVTARSPE